MGAVRLEMGGSAEVTTWGAVGLEMGRIWGRKWGAVGLKMGRSAEIPNVGPVQALKMGGSGAENGGQR